MNDLCDKILDIFEQPRLWIALQAICRYPQQELRLKTTFVDLGKAQNMDPASFGLSALEPGAIAITDRMSHFTSQNQKWRFLKSFDRQIVRNKLTPANQFVAYFVRYSLKFLKGVAFSLKENDYDQYFALFLRQIRRLNGIWEALSEEYKYAPMDELPIDNQMLAFDPRYHVILEAYLACEAI